MMNDVDIYKISALDLARDFVRRGWSVDDAVAEVVKIRAEHNEPLTPVAAELMRNELHWDGAK